MSYVPVIIQKKDPDTEAWTNLLSLHAIKVNKAGSGESFSAGREQFRLRLVFEFRWSQVLENLRWNTQDYRLMYRGHPMNIKDWDDYMEQHLTVRITGEAYG